MICLEEQNSKDQIDSDLGPTRNNDVCRGPVLRQVLSFEAECYMKVCRHVVASLLDDTAHDNRRVALSV